MVFQKTTEFLLENFPDKRVDLFNDDYTKELYAYLASFVEDDLSNRKEEIREAFIDFFKDLGMVFVVFRGLEKIVVRIRPYESNIDKKKIVEKVLLILDLEKEDILKSAPREDLIAISDSLLIRLHSSIENECPQVDKKEILKVAVTKSFSLTEKDVVVYLKGKLFIRLFKGAVKKAKIATSQSSSGGKEKRFNGLPPEELNKLNKEIFPKGVESDLPTLTKIIIGNGIDFSRINNDFYEKNHIQIIQKSFKDFLSKKVNVEQFVLDGFVNFIFRETFELVHKHLAINLIETFYLQKGTAEDFLKYYSGNTVVADGGKYKLPMIIDANGGEWKVPVIKTIVKQRFVNIDKIKEKEKMIAKVHNSIKTAAKNYEKYSQALESSQANTEKNEEELNELLGILMDKRKILKAKREELKKNPTDEVLSKEINDFALEIKGDARREAELLQLRVRLEKEINVFNHKSISEKQQVEALQKKVEEDMEKLQEFAESVKDIEDKYQILIDALTKALLKKKTKL